MKSMQEKEVIKTCDKSDCFVIHNERNDKKYCFNCKRNTENKDNPNAIDNYMTSIQKYGY